MENKGRFSGKRLLVLGGSYSTVDIVKTAQAMGLYVIVTDNSNTGPAKEIANESAMISTADIDALAVFSRGKNINGVFTGASEFNISNALLLCECLSLPFYVSRKYWEIATNKKIFKDYFGQIGLPVAKTLALNPNFLEASLGEIKYPIVVKPVDGCSGQGVFVCRNDQDVMQACEHALNVSKRKQLLFEEFIEGDEISILYTCKNGKMSLSIMGDKYMNESIGRLPLSEAYIFPSKHLSRYVKELNNKVITIFQDDGWNDGVLFIQGKVNETGFTFFEMNYRIGGSNIYKFIAEINQINYLEMCINYSLTGKMLGYDLNQDNPFFDKNCCNLNIYVREGTIGQIIGIDEIKNFDGIIAYDQHFNLGEKVPYSGTLDQIIFRFYVMQDNLIKLKNTIESICNTIEVKNEKGENMLYEFSKLNRDIYFSIDNNSYT